MKMPTNKNFSNYCRAMITALTDENQELKKNLSLASNTQNELKVH
jgi:hypothetical protein